MIALSPLTRGSRSPDLSANVVGLGLGLGLRLGFIRLMKNTSSLDNLPPLILFFFFFFYVELEAELDVDRKKTQSLLDTVKP